MSSAINLQSLNFGPSAEIMEGSGGLQAYVDQSVTLSAVNGAPSSTQFRSSVVNRAAIPDITKDLKVSMGIDRIMIQQIAEIQGEFGQSGERVFGAVNDDKGLIRFVGNWQNIVDNFSNYSPYSATQNDYIEIVFYGTGLNLLCAPNGAIDVRATVDGAAEVASNIITASSQVIYSRNYTPNTIWPVTSGLSLGIHTVKLRLNSSSLNWRVYGFEVLNASASLNVNPGSAFSQFKKNSLTSAITSSYNSSFNQILKDGVVSGSLGTRGARALVYLDTDGSVKKRAVAVNSTQANLTSADHTNEEIVRTYSPVEFGAGRSDDFSNSSSGTKAFTLDDGTTSLVSNGCSVSKQNQIFGVSLSGSGNFVTLTFIGTGLDIARDNFLTSQPLAITVNGVSVGSLTALSTGPSFRIDKIVSGLPYGTHTVKITLGAGSYNEAITKFIVYGPKKPSLPSGAIELADYNIMADYAAVTGTAVVDNNQKPFGILNKLPLREFTYVGTWTTTGDSNAPGNTYTITSTNTDYLEYNFFGTGFSTHMLADAATYDFTVTIDGSLNSSGTARANASNLGGGSYRSTSTTTNAPCRIEFTGLSAANHKVRITKTAGTSMRVGGIDIITPIHSAKSNVNADFQNTLPVGSQAISDNRKVSLVKNDTSVKYRGVALGVASSPTTTSTTYIPCPDMSLVVPSKGAWFEVLSQSQVEAGANTIQMALFINGQQINNESGIQTNASNYAIAIVVNQLVYLPAGVHKIDIYWKAGVASTVYVTGTRRNLIVKEL